ncbi:MAG: hypothetical protein DMF73_16675, partial [Acidobacteria bacterium]
MMNNRTRFLFLFGVLLVLSTPRLALTQVQAAPWLTDTERTKFENLRIVGSEALFNLDYETAR